jgi:peptidoglycan/xylan/chitin deacetylase (PgdA/CDA1 family)
MNIHHQARVLVVLVVAVSLVLGGWWLIGAGQPEQESARELPPHEIVLPPGVLPPSRSIGGGLAEEKLPVVPAPAPEELSPTSPVVSPSEAEPLKDRKLVALTFDDGPSAVTTPRLLDILGEQEVKATFFVLGSRVKRYPEVVKRAAAAGHQVGSHTMNHKNLAKLSADAGAAEINNAATALREVLGTAPTLMRPPYGEVNETVKRLAGTPLILWSVDPQDWKYRNTDTVYQNVVSKTRDGSIVLMHDIYATTVEAAERIVVELKRVGYTFVMVDELIGARGTRENGRTYRHLYP